MSDLNKKPKEKKQQEDKRYKIWYVDDLKSNRDDFENFFNNPPYSRTFKANAFGDIQEVKDLLKDERPHALLCDIFWYDNSGTAEKVEDIMRNYTTEMKKSIKSFEDPAYRGVELAKYIFREIDPVTFPIYAYTSKGAYLLETEKFNEIVKSNMRWLFKLAYKSPKDNKFHLDVESIVYTLEKDFKDYEKFKKHPFIRFFYSPSRLSKIVLGFTMTTSILEAVYIISHWVFKI